MNDLVKTLIFVGVSVVVAVGAYVWRPAPFEQPRQTAGEKLFGDIEDATIADALEIRRFDRDQSKSVELIIQRDGDEWVIASHNDYPADASGAKERIQDVAVNLMELEILDIASELVEDHALFGVVEPPEKDEVLEADEEDVGLLVGLMDEDGNVLGRMIIGKEVRDEQSTEVKRFVRKAGEPTIYTAKIEVDDFKSDFSEWIESDLLKISSADIRRVIIKDYSARLVEVAPGQMLTATDPRFDLTADWNDADSKWEFVDMVERRGNRLVPTKLTEDEELNQDKLNDLKQAVGDLQIVDVDRKPKQLVEGVKSDEDLINDRVLAQTLREKGFFPSRGVMKASEGEIRIQTKDAVEYILRFGEAASVVTDDENESQLTRYMLVSAAVAEEQLVIKEDSDDGPTSDSPLTPPLGAGGQAGDEGDAGTESENEANDDEPETATEPESDPDTDDESDEPDEPSDEPEGEDPLPMPPDTIPPGDEGPSAEDELAAKRKQAQEKVAELNERFVNWFYVISEDEYKKLHLGRFDLIKEKDGSSFGIDELRNLDDLPEGPEGLEP